MTIQELSKLSGISVKNIKEWESGKTKPRIRSLIKLVLFYKISMKDILGV